VGSFGSDCGVAEQGLPPDPRGRHRLLRRDTDAESLLPVRCLIQSMKLIVAVDFEPCRLRCFLFFPSSGITRGDALESDEMLAMLYIMAIMR
jgi:hypothetical protein